MNQELAAEIALIKESLEYPYATPYGCLYAPFDEDVFNACREVAARLTAYNPTLFLLVGIGGSNMGTLAVLHALPERERIRFYCADTLDADGIESLLILLQEELVAGGVPLVCIVTKSGSTAETLINAALLYECIKNYRPDDYHKYIVVITDENSPLAHVAHDAQFELLVVPQAVGGRYSIFSAVGLFPLCMMGIDVPSFIKGAQQMFKRCINDDMQSNKAVGSALTLFQAYSEGYLLHDIFVFSPSLVMLGHWYKQLIGESLGKKHTKQGTLVEVGISPTVSVGTVDLHSVVQLYLAGPRIRITTFLSIDDEPTDLKIPDNELSRILPELVGKSVTAVKKSIYKGVLRAYQKEQRPFMECSLSYRSSETLGGFMMMKMIETIFLARLFSINAFDQPQVELYKKEARQEL